jgi:hypothetical protein
MAITSLLLETMTLIDHGFVRRTVTLQPESASHGPRPITVSLLPHKLGHFWLTP